MVGVGDITRTMPHLPRALARPHVRIKRLKLQRVEAPQPPIQSTRAWRAGENGRSLHWWVKQMTDPVLVDKLFC